LYPDTYRAYASLFYGFYRRFLFGLRWIVSEQPLTLAVGMAANDISMLTEAHVGVATGSVSLTQPNEAVLCSDYMIPRFHHLARLMFVHGHHNYFRLSKAALICLYKNLLLPISLFL
jgi:P-type E1-E2 ATPase